jgi:hypothetical protein
MNNPKSHPLYTLRRFVLSAGLGLALCIGSSACAAEEPLPSWNDGPAKKAILEFVAAVTDKNNKDYVEPVDRIAVFDHDGTLWVESPMYTQILVGFERAKKPAL